ncbi:hypothetical protein CXB51_028741 [Gossypium anomalum]|uniref:Integrase catalytic domain-containing protein n=1 Tax=Gossypium anomalum TaxID=47600 RepID=A0A8J5YD13_9ROSI|nr:hypothetical protein CXB51_028741 [Gossypium anomalum]
MNPELQKQYEDMVAYDMIEHLKELYQGQARQERFDISKALFQCKLAEGSPIGPHVLKMIDSYSQFVLNFNMNEIDKTLPQLLSMLRTAEGNMKKVRPKPILMVRNNKGKGKAKIPTKPKGKGRPNLGKGKAALKPKGGVSKEGNYFHCGVTGHWKQNCPVYLEEIKKAKASGTDYKGVGLWLEEMWTCELEMEQDRYGYVYLMRHKSEALEKFKEFKNEVQNQLGKTIRTLRSDRGGEYLSLEFDNILKECGIVSQLTPPSTPQWNRVSERRNQTLLDMVRSMMSHADLSTSFWGHALKTTIFTLNRVPSKSVQMTPYEMWTGKRPSMSFMKIWGCKAYVKRQTSTKLEPKSKRCIFVRYPKETKGYYFFNPTENKVFVARTGVFLKREFVSRKGSGRKIELEEIRESQDTTEPEIEQQQIPQEIEEQVTAVETQPPCRSLRERHAPERYGFLITTHGDILLMDQDEPRTYQEAVASPDSEK